MLRQPEPAVLGWLNVQDARQGVAVQVQALPLEQLQALAIPPAGRT